MSRTKALYGNAAIPPATGAAAASLLPTCDPALSGLASVFQAALRAKLDTAWRAAAQSFGSEEGNHVVNSTVVLADPDISDEARLTWTWPVLVMWRVNERFADRTLVWDGQESEVAMVYALPPMSKEFADRLGHIRKAVVRTLRAVIEQQGDASYDAEDNFLEDLGIEALSLTEATYGAAFDDAGLSQVHLGVDMTLVLKEIEEPYTADLVDTTSITANIAFEDDSGDLEHVIDLDVDPTE